MSASPRLAVLIPSLQGGGAERVVVNLLHGFRSREVAVDLLLVRPRGPLLDEVPPDVRVVPLSGGRILASLPALVRYLREERPDALLSHLDAMNVVALWARRIARVPTRVVVTTHLSLSRDARSSGVKQWATVQLMRRFYPWADAVVGVSRGVAEGLAATIGHGRIEPAVVHNPVFTERLRNVVQERRIEDGPQDIPGLPETAKLVLSAGRLASQKNHALLVDAFAILAASDPDVHLVILGEGPQRDRLEDQIRKLGLSDRVSLRGFVRDPSRYYAAASVFALSSRWEGLPTVLIEALAFGCPVVSTDCPSGPAEVLDAGRFGKLVPMDDPAALAQGLRDTLAEEQDIEALQHRAAEFTTERAVDRYLRLLFPGGVFPDVESGQELDR